MIFKFFQTKEILMTALDSELEAQSTLGWSVVFVLQSASASAVIVIFGR